MDDGYMTYTMLSNKILNLTPELFIRGVKMHNTLGNFNDIFTLEGNDIKI